MEVNHIFFDLDRTLWDFDRNSESTLRQLFNESVVRNALDFEAFHTSYQRINNLCWELYRKGEMSAPVLRRERFRRVFALFNVRDKAEIERWSVEYMEICPRMGYLMPHATETLNRLAAKNYDLHIITNGFTDVQNIKLETAEISSFFGKVITSETAQARKPMREIFQFAVAQTKAQKHRSVMVGDDLECDVNGPLRFGFQAVLFHPDEKTRPRVPKGARAAANLAEVGDLLGA